MEGTVGPVSTCGRELLQGWRWPIGLMMSFTIFTASVSKILDTTLCFFKRFLYWYAWWWPKYRPKHVAHIWRHSLSHNKPVLC
jgi:hypothetical protein